jgi:hypothetical protein
MATALCLAFFLAAMTGSGLWLLAVDRRALRPVMTTAVLLVAISGYVAVLFAL